MSILMSFLLLIASPVWPLGENPIVGDPFIIVNKKINQLAFINEGEIKETYEVTTGKEQSLTPEGTFTVVVKAQNPYYRKKNIPGGVKENPLGTRWLGFDAENTDGRIYGIHGTNTPHLIGYNLSNGCVRMRNNEVESLYERIPLGTKVFIVSSQKSFEQLAESAGAIP
ncbi:L,D-transpeptidase [Bacillus taeanensis]|uniref:L,D-transpeptidase n=1 Tax=Bacillus taeanensis TaxID=273032 RepID=A0A366XW78_9BACI|nr:L,D-transpeptidase [Bacillus taeanensis]RBW70660.1 L,D-transpeptidase [Bacillus taeanensis]